MLTATRHVVAGLLRHWSFTCAMAGRDLKGMNRGAILGWAWLVIRPLILVSMYVGVITYVFAVRLAEGANQFDYALDVLSGLIVWQVLAKTIEEAPGLVQVRADFLRQVVYPTETLPLTQMLSGAPAPLVGLGVYLVLALISGHATWSQLLLPVPILLLFLFCIGLSWLLMIAGLIIKDLREVVPVVIGTLFYVSPILFSEGMVRPEIWQVLLLNPLAHVIVCFRDVLQGGWHPLSWTVFTVMAAIFFILGAAAVDRMKLVINDYL